LDTESRGTQYVHESGRSDSGPGALETGSGTADQGTGPERDESGTIPGDPDWTAHPTQTHGPQVPGAWEDVVHFRLQVLEKLTRETSNDTKLALIRLLDEEGNRSLTIAEAEMQTDGEVELRALDQNAREDSD